LVNYDLANISISNHGHDHTGSAYFMNIAEDRQQRVAENILGNERLTADLDDTAAKASLDWGLDWAMAAVSETAAMEDEQAETFLSPRLKALRRMLRQVNLWIRDQDSSTAEEQLERLAKIYHQAQLAQGYPEATEMPAAFVDKALQLRGSASERVANLRLLLDEEQE
jgi:hypothetical protein